VDVLASVVSGSTSPFIFEGALRCLASSSSSFTPSTWRRLIAVVLHFACASSWVILVFLSVQRGPTTLFGRQRTVPKDGGFPGRISAHVQHLGG
jgi:hypothetical protein